MGLINFFKKNKKKPREDWTVEFIPGSIAGLIDNEEPQEQHKRRECTWAEYRDYVTSGEWEQETGTVLKPTPREVVLKKLEQMEKEAAERRAKGID